MATEIIYCGCMAAAGPTLQSVITKVHITGAVTWAFLSIFSNYFFFVVAMCDLVHKFGDYISPP